MCSRGLSFGRCPSLTDCNYASVCCAHTHTQAPEDDEKRERFLADFERERSIVRGLRHPNLCRLYGVSASPGDYCLIYDFLEGR